MSLGEIFGLGLVGFFGLMLLTRIVQDAFLRADGIDPAELEQERRRNG